MSQTSKLLGDIEVLFWSYSLACIASIKPLKKCIANRVTEFKELVKNQRWKYCPTDTTPSDLQIRDILTDKFLNII